MVEPARAKESKGKEQRPAASTKTCSRGHTYTGPGGCPVCWKGNAKGKPAGS